MDVKTFPDIFAVCEWLKVPVRYENWGARAMPRHGVGDPPRDVCWSRDDQGHSYISVDLRSGDSLATIAGCVGHELAHILVGEIAPRGDEGDLIESAVLVVEHTLIRMLDSPAREAHMTHYEDYGWHWRGEPEVVPFGRQIGYLRIVGTIDDFRAFPATNSWRVAVKELHRIWNARR